MVYGNNNKKDGCCLIKLHLIDHQTKLVVQKIHSTETMTMTSCILFKIVFLSVACVMGVNAWMSPISCREHSHTSYTSLLVVSRDIGDSVHHESTEYECDDAGDEEKEEVNVPYVISRGDGTKGGGGLPMPAGRQSSSSEHQGDDSEKDGDDILRRPKVSADMPLG
jgi:hypothetical protein